jgi:hypothetical protein
VSSARYRLRCPGVAPVTIQCTTGRRRRIADERCCANARRCDERSGARRAPLDCR